MERDAFLSRVRSAVARASLPERPDGDPGLLVPELPEVDLVARFSEALEAVDGTVHRGEDPEEVVEGIMAARRASGFISWDGEHLPVPGIVDRLVARGYERVGGVVPAEGRRDHQRTYGDLLVGITAAEAGLAESGSIVLRSGPGRPRMASLIPLVHVALLPADRIHRSLAHWAERHVDRAVEAANLIVVTGPSRTGDIEMNLNLGVHGPGELHVVLL